MGTPLGVALLFHEDDLPRVAECDGVRTVDCGRGWHLATSEDADAFGQTVDGFTHAFLIERFSEGDEGRVSLFGGYEADTNLRGYGDEPLNPFNDAILCVCDSATVINDLSDEEQLDGGQARSAYLFGDEVWCESFKSVVPNKKTIGKMDRLDALPDKGERDLHGNLNALR